MQQASQPVPAFPGPVGSKKWVHLFPRPEAATPVLFPFPFLLHDWRSGISIFHFINCLYLVVIVKPSVFLVHTVLNMEVFQNYFYYFNASSPPQLPEK